MIIIPSFDEHGTINYFVGRNFGPGTVKYKNPSFSKNIVPFGVGNGFFPDHWLSEKNGKNIIQLNKHYGEHSCIYWVWKNYLNEFQDDDWIGFCHYRKFWLNRLYDKKQK